MMCDRNTPTKFRLYLDLHENRSHDSLQTAPTSCPELDEVQHDLSLYGCGKIIVLNDFCVLFAVPSPLMLLSAIPPTVAHSIVLLAGDRRHGLSQKRWTIGGQS